MYAVARAALGVLLLSTPAIAHSQAGASSAASKTLVVILAHADDEAPVGPILARYAREGVHVYMIIASDGSQGAGQQGHLQRPDSISPGDDLARTRADEARCAAQTLGIQPPILLGFPDGKLGDYIGDRSLMYRLTQRIAGELEKLHPDAMVTWGPDGGVGHPDHRLVSNVVTQLSRYGAPGVPERLYYMYLPVEAIRAMNPQRGEPPLLIPQAKYFTVRVPFTPEDLQAAERSMLCHKTQFTPEAAQRVLPATSRVWNGVISLIPAFTTAPGTDLFR
ncbi:MAG TPA: PIG-L family deacetylase [Gemmatimonadaceae bacterium]|nr:PIG-L family deacetylase [Gemmatimonadaceae bacterium]